MDRPYSAVSISSTSSRVDGTRLGLCICCNSQLRYPESVSCFKCTVCRTINDLNPPHISQNKLHRYQIHISRLRHAIFEFRNGNKSSYSLESFQKEIRIGFSTFEILNELCNNDKITTGDEAGILFDEVRDLYRMILDMPPPIIKTMMNSIESILIRPGRHLLQPSDLKFLLIIMENPLLAQQTYPEESQYHHNILKRIFGLISSLGNELHRSLMCWFTRYSISTFRRKVDLVNRFISYRLIGYRKKYPNSSVVINSMYDGDWKMIAAAKVMAILFSANTISPKIPLSDFYNTLVDQIDLISDYDAWQHRIGKFAFCQYPFLISMGAKMEIMNIDARRQMDSKVKEAIFTSIFRKKQLNPYLELRIRRTHLIEDSLTQLSINEMDLKKKLKIEFVGEDGIDAGGLTKEWFMLLVRELFNPQYGMFTLDEESMLFWFNPASFETSDQYFLVGVVIGLAIYNSTILDIHFPLACYKKLLGNSVGLSDLYELRPSLARGLETLLQYQDDDVYSVFCLHFVVEYEAFGEIRQYELIPNGKQVPVTKENKEDYVRLYANFVLSTSIAKQFEPFKRGFYFVCGGNALSLFRPKEIELLVRGSPEPLDINQLKSITTVEGFEADEPTVGQFWQIVEEMTPEMHKKLLIFITGTDRIPAFGTSSLSLSINKQGEDCDRLPIAYTCFNQLCLYSYSSLEKLQSKLYIAITEGSGFGLK